MTRRVVVTGLGVRAPGGSGARQFWDLLSSGRTATRSITSFDASACRSQVAGEIDFDPAAEGLSPREIRRMDRAAQFAVVCSREAVADSGLSFEGVRPERIGVSVGSAVAAAMSLEKEYRVLSDQGREWEVDPTYLTPHMFDHMVPSVLGAGGGRGAPDDPGRAPAGAAGGGAAAVDGGPQGLVVEGEEPVEAVVEA
ncbi:beta-ketoacyl synthase N-terminal-like domain-containing protein, partial [Streptomyces sp. NPDC057540]|uniref:beta-ketoacyl synthase N-terminal-like domain-containing protein n=1 Tax=Streptomyces sp. NPDC057540 TaxID=3346160 RepID=UPI003689D5A7